VEELDKSVDEGEEDVRTIMILMMTKVLKR